MTVPYTSKLRTVKHSGIGVKRIGWFRLLFIWKGSLYKLVWVDYIAWLLLYFTFSIVYRFAFNAQQRLGFENWCNFCHSHLEIIPLELVLGFFVTILISRWWDQFKCLPWPDNTGVKMNYVCPGSDTESLIIRKTVVRYVSLGTVITYRQISSIVAKRFPTYKHIVERKR